MCHLQELVAGKKGYIIRCPECRNYQVLFAGILLSLSQEEFTLFAKQVKAREESWNNGDVENILVPTPKAGVHMILSLHDFAQLQQMLDTAADEETALELMQLFHL